MKPLQEMQVKKKDAFRPGFTTWVLFAELCLYACLYFALKSGNVPVTALVIGMIVLGYFGLVWQK